MPKGIPTSRSERDIAPLDVTRLKKAPLIKMGAFKSISNKKNERTGEEYEITQIKLSLDFDSGYSQRNSDGDLILDEAGNEVPHLINEGFITLSGDKRSNLVAILKALGFRDKRFIEGSGKNKGGLTEDAIESVEVVFGANGLVDDYSGAEWDDLPYYTLPRDGGQQAKRDVEVPVLSFKIMGYEVLGRRCDLALTIKDDYNRVESYLAPEEPDPLEAAPKPVRGISKPTQAHEEDTPLDPETPPPWKGDYPEPTTKAAIFVDKKMNESGIPLPFRVAVARLVSGMDDFEDISEISTGAAKNIRDMLKTHPDALKEAWEMAASGKAQEPADDFDDEEEDL
jgi:hypothetical protein